MVDTPAPAIASTSAGVTAGVAPPNSRVNRYRDSHVPTPAYGDAGVSAGTPGRKALERAAGSPPRVRTPGSACTARTTSSSTPSRTMRRTAESCHRTVGRGGASDRLERLVTGLE